MPDFSPIILDLKDPTRPENYVDRVFAKGTPLNWRDDVTGTLTAAVWGYLNQRPTDEQLSLVIAYLQYHIHAQCWLETSPFGDVDEEMATEIRALRELSLTLKTIQDVHAYSSRAMNIALDPW